MKTKVLWALVALNVLLLALLVSPFGKENTATAQAAAAAGGRPSDYTQIPGDVIGGSSSLVYVIDADNQQLSAIVLSQNGKAIDTMPPMDLKRVFQGP